MSHNRNETADQRLAMLISFYIFYLFVGALVFNALESPHERSQVNALNDYVRAFQRQHDACMSDKELTQFVRLVSAANDKGVPAIGSVSKDPNWSIGQSIFFAGTVLTTIGYGDVTVQTPLGKVFCILFALAGIPFTLLLLAAILERLMKFTSEQLLPLYGKCIQLIPAPVTANGIRLFGQSRRRKEEADGAKETNLDGLSVEATRTSFAVVSACLVGVVFFLVPALVYARIEGWSFLNAFYYCFISLSTVGLGDFVPGDRVDQTHRRLYKVVSTIYLMCGVMVMVWLIQVFGKTAEFNLYKYFKFDDENADHDDQNQKSAIMVRSKSELDRNHQQPPITTRTVQYDAINESLVTDEEENTTTIS